MRLLFREGDTRNAKLVTLAFGAVLGIALLGLLNANNIVPKAALRPWGYVVGLLIGVAVFVAMNKDTNPVSKHNHYGPVKRFAALVCLFCFGGAMGFCCVWLGLPTMWSKVVLTPHSAEASIVSVWKERTGRGCSYKIEVAGGPLPKVMNPCVSKEIWAASRSGNAISVSYTESAIAFVIEDLQLTDQKK